MVLTDEDRKVLRTIGILGLGGVLVVAYATGYQSPPRGKFTIVDLLHAFVPGVIGIFGRLWMAEGRARERARGLRAAVRSLCRVLSIPLTERREEELAQMDTAEIEALRERLERERRWD